MQHTQFDLVVIGGGAAGFFAAILAAERNLDLRIVICERGKSVLQKVKISGGGRCNATHACYDPRDLVKHYPRGEQELRGPFSRFQPGDTIDWFYRNGVELKTEADGRMFPTTDDSQTIIDCFWRRCKQLGIQVQTASAVDDFKPLARAEGWRVVFREGSQITTRCLLVAAGSNVPIWRKLAALGHSIEAPVPSLFTFNTKDVRLRNLAGLSVPNAQLEVAAAKLSSTGPLLITHWGLSGPAVLKLSAWGARALHGLDYRFSLTVNWLGTTTPEMVENRFEELRQEQGKKQVKTLIPFDVPRRLWESFCAFAKAEPPVKWAELTRTQLDTLRDCLVACSFAVAGKSTFKEEFVTAGGVELKEVDFKRFESKIHPGLFFAGEVLNIDGITGGFNFQAAWTGAWHVAQAVANVLSNK